MVVTWLVDQFQSLVGASHVYRSKTLFYDASSIIISSPIASLSTIEQRLYCGECNFYAGLVCSPPVGVFCLSKIVNCKSWLSCSALTISFLAVLATQLCHYFMVKMWYRWIPKWLLKPSTLETWIEVDYQWLLCQVFYTLQNMLLCAQWRLVSTLPKNHNSSLLWSGSLLTVGVSPDQHLLL